MTCRRFTNAGQMTNYEMAGLRKDQTWRESRWVQPWSSLAYAMPHVRSQEEWDQWNEGEEEQGVR